MTDLLDFNDFSAFSLVFQDDPTHILSNVEKNGEWKTRPIALWGVLKSFVSQLKSGSEITKISLPAELCYPYSMLEMMAYRQLSLFKMLFGVNEEADALQRMLIILKFFACLPRAETHNKKPWNPILGENHMARIYDEQNGFTEFISEQISHHPPVSAISVRNEKHQFDIRSNLQFGVKFGGNSAGINISGASHLNLTKIGETYRFSRCIPSMLVRNLVLGTKYITWEGDCIITCEQTGLEAKISFKEGWSRNTVMTGSIYHKDFQKLPIYTIDPSNSGEEIKLIPNVKTQATLAAANIPITLKETSKFLLIDVASQVNDQILYLPVSKLEPMSSVIVWGGTNAGVLVHDTVQADEEKSYVEQEQRRIRAEREANGVPFDGHYFKQDGDLWILREGFSIKGMIDGSVPVRSMDSYNASGKGHVPKKPHPDAVHPPPITTEANSNAAVAAPSDIATSPDDPALLSATDPSIHQLVELAQHDNPDSLLSQTPKSETPALSSSRSNSPDASSSVEQH